jgi:hypothetical protein
MINKLRRYLRSLPYRAIDAMPITFYEGKIAYYAYLIISRIDRKGDVSSFLYDAIDENSDRFPR